MTFTKTVFLPVDPDAAFALILVAESAEWLDRLTAFTGRRVASV